MGSDLLNMSDRLARAAMAADSDDPSTLAEIHTLLEQVKAETGMGEAARARGPMLRQFVATTMALVERIILREVQDTGAAVKQLSAEVAEIQRMIVEGTGEAADGALAAGVAAPAAAASSPAAAAPLVGDAPASDPPGGEGGTTLKEEDLPLIGEFIAEAAGHLESAEAELLKLESNPQDTDAINAVFRGFHTIKGVAGFLGLQDIGALAHAAENLLDLGRKGSLEITGGNFELVLEAGDAMKGLLGALDAAAKSRTVLLRDPALLRLIHRLHIAAGNVAASGGDGPGATVIPQAAGRESSSRVTAGVENAAAGTTGSAAPARAGAPSETSPSKSAKTGDATVKIATDRLDKLINAVGELVIAHSMTNQDMSRIAAADQRLQRNMTHLGKITRELQDLAMSMRMVPIHGVFQKMTRLVRDLSHKSGKEIELVLTGAETELDRNVVEAISDPLVHMVRNAADHGIELPADREKAGKRRAGRLELKAYHQAGNIVIEIADDGKGLDKGRILKKALAAGIVREGQELSEQEIFRLIFHAGLSTAEKVTDVSGRGVGMDVVRKNVDALRGRVDIASVEGKGSTFAIRLPLTLAVIDGLVVKIGQEMFIVPILSIEQSLRPTAEQLSTVQSREEMCLVRGRLLPIIRLHRLFNIKPQTEDPTKSLVVIVHENERRCCLLIDELLGQQQVVIKSLGKLLGQVPGTSGGAIMGNGCVSLILDVPGLIDLAGKQ